MTHSVFPFVSRWFMIACWSICIMTALKPLSSHFSIYVIWALAFVDWFSPRELRTLWLLVCCVILDLILNVLNSILNKTQSWGTPMHNFCFSRKSIWLHSSGKFLPPFCGLLFYYQFSV